MTVLEETLETNKVQHKCFTCILLDTIKPSLAEEIRETFRHPEICSTTISKVLKNRGYDIPEYSIQRHRRLHEKPQ